jgi:hypothetical protein
LSLGATTPSAVVISWSQANLRVRVHNSQTADAAREGARETAEEAEAQTRQTRPDGGEPWPGYDNQGVHEINKRLTNADPDLARRVRDYERRNKKRSMVLERAREKAA